MKTIYALLACLLIATSIQAQPEADNNGDCTDFKTGKFVSEEGTKIHRKKRTQIESWTVGDKTHKVWLKIKWTSDCSYTLIFKKSTDPRMKNNRKLYVEMYDIKKNSYKMRTRWEGQKKWKAMGTHTRE